MKRTWLWLLLPGLALALAGCVDHACLSACSARHQACVTAARNTYELGRCDQVLNQCSQGCHPL